MNTRVDTNSLTDFQVAVKEWAAGKAPWPTCQSCQYIEQLEDDNSSVCSLQDRESAPLYVDGSHEIDAWFATHKPESPLSVCGSWEGCREKA